MSKQRAARPAADVTPPSIEDRAQAAGVAVLSATPLPRGLTSEQARANIDAQYRSLTPEIKDAIRHARKVEGKSYSVIQREFGVMNPVVSRVLNERQEPVTIDQKLNHIASAPEGQEAHRAALEASVQTTFERADDKSQVISFRLNAAETRALRSKAFKCPTCRQVVSKPNAIIRMLLRRQLGLDLLESLDDDTE